MRRINNIHQLNAEKKRIGRKRDELLQMMRFTWMDLKYSLKPGHFAGRKNTTSEQENEQYSILSDAAGEMAARLARKMAGKAEDTIGKWFRKEKE